ncbi:MAG: 1,4-beta-xylanase [Flavobacteriaceae bacterium]|nr:1,4-beta-xylanase [Flavobacteriaceae bacterium]
MKKKTNRIIFSSYFLIVICLFSCVNTNVSSSQTFTKSLKSHFENKFFIGAAINESTILGKDDKSYQIVNNQFNSITPENSLKWMYIQPKPNQFDFNTADQYVQMGLDNGMYIIGHALVWHAQLAEFMQETKNKNEFRSHVENHINRLVKRYKGKIDAWDVVNEAFEEDGKLRNSIFYKNMGENYIEEVFKLAEKLDPEADLIYNDYNLYKPKKRNAVIEMVKQFKANGTKISGVGVQAHWGLNYPTIDEIEQIIYDFHIAGVSVSFTELDISVLPNPWELVGAEVNQNFSKFEGDPKMNPYPDNLPNEVALKLANRYYDIFRLFVKHSDKIERVTFWGVTDKYSWLNDWPIKGRINYPLLYDRSYKSKEAYRKVLQVKTN